MSLLVVLADEGGGELTLAAAARAVQQQHGPIALELITAAFAELAAEGYCTSEYNDEGMIVLWRFPRGRTGGTALPGGQSQQADA